MAVFEKFGDETDINLPAESIEKKGIFYHPTIPCRDRDHAHF